MAEVGVPINLGSGANVAAWPDSAGFDRQVVVVGDTAANTATVDAAGALTTKERRPTASAVTTVPSTITATTLLASNASALVRKLENASSSVLYVLEGGTGTVSATNRTFALQPGERYEWPQPAYTGVVTGVWQNANGQANCTEQT